MGCSWRRRWRSWGRTVQGPRAEFKVQSSRFKVEADGATEGRRDGETETVGGGDTRVVHWVQHQWDALWHSAAHQLLRAKLYGLLPFDVVYRRATSGQFGGLIEVERL